MFIFYSIVSYLKTFIKIFKHGINRLKFANVARLNQNIIFDKNINIPVTISVSYDTDKITIFSHEKILTSLSDHCNVFFKKMKTDECAIHCIKNNIGKHIVVMNHASRNYHGGSYKTGAISQEEDLCRLIPQLYSSLCNVEYPFDADTVLITPNVKIMRNSTNYNFYDSNQSYFINVCSVAAPDLNTEQFDLDRVKRTLINMYISVKLILPETDTLILGAWDLYFVYIKICFLYIEISYILFMFMM